MKNGLFKSLCIITALLFIFTLIPTAAYADGDTSSPKNVVYTSATKPNADTSGDGSRENPYNRFEDAVSNVADGGTIYIIGPSAFINTREEAGTSPYFLNKNVTVRSEGSESATLIVRAAGIVMGGNVTFENITLGFVNKYHSGLFANGHSLTLNNVSRDSGSRLVHIFAGGLFTADGWACAEPLSGGSVSISGGSTELGRVFAGGMNAGQAGNVAISVKGSGNMRLGDIYACGALEPQINGNWFDTTEPPDPEGADSLKINGAVSVMLDDAPINSVSGRGALGDISVEFKTTYPNSNISLIGITNLDVQSGTLSSPNITSSGTLLTAGFGTISVREGATLNLASNVESVVTMNFIGGGRLILGRNEKLTVTKSLTGTTVFETDGGNNGSSGYVNANHTYIEAPGDSEGTFTFTPAFSQAGSTIKSEISNGKKLWSINVVSSTAYLTRLECAEPKKSVRYSDIPEDTVTLAEFDVIAETDPSSVGFPEFVLKAKFNGEPQATEEEPENYLIEIDALNIIVFMTPKLGSSDGYELCVEAMDRAREVKSGAYEITVSSPSKDGQLSFTAELTILPESGSGEGGDNTGTGGGNTGSGGGGGGSSGGSGSGGSSGGSSSSGDKSESKPDSSATEIKPAWEIFTDVKAGSWYGDAVSFVIARKLFNGVSENSFAPNSAMSRAMTVTVLARMSGEDVEGASPWYAKSAEWAVRTGISDGNNINDSISREQFVTMLYRFAGSPASDTPGADGGGISAFADGESVSAWARDAMSWAVSSGIITGDESLRLMPSASATRAEIAAILERFIKLSEKE